MKDEFTRSLQNSKKSPPYSRAMESLSRLMKKKSYSVSLSECVYVCMHMPRGKESDVNKGYSVSLPDCVCVCMHVPRGKESDVKKSYSVSLGDETVYIREL